MQKALRLSGEDLVWNGSDAAKKQKFFKAYMFEQALFGGEFEARPKVGATLTTVTRLTGIFWSVPLVVRQAIQKAADAAQAAADAKYAQRFDRNASRIGSELIREFAPEAAADFEKAPAPDKARTVLRVVGDIEKSTDFPNGFSLMIADLDPSISKDALTEGFGPEQAHLLDGWSSMHVGQRVAVVRRLWRDALGHCNKLVGDQSPEELGSFIKLWKLDSTFRSPGRQAIKRGVRGSASVVPYADEPVRVAADKALDGIDFGAMVALVFSEEDQRAYRNAKGTEKQSYNRAAAALVVAYRLAFLLAS